MKVGSALGRHVQPARPETAPLGASLAGTVPFALTALALLIWAISLPGVNLLAMNDTGLVSVLPFSFYIALVLLTVSFAYAIAQPQPREALLLFDVAAFIIVIHATPNILYGTLRYAWAWKHVGIVDYILRHGRIDPRIDLLSAYHNWPGFFAASALLTQVAGFPSALSFAGWGPLFFNVIDLGALVLIFKSNTQDLRLVWLGIWLYFITSWVGQDYFSPQAFAFFLYLIVLGLILRWFRMPAPVTRVLSGESPGSRLRSFLYQVRIRSTAFGTAETTPTPMQRVGLMLFAILLLAVIASTHQLTPFMTISALAALVFFRFTSARNLPTIMAVFTATWILYVAVAFLNGNLFWIVTSIGSLLGNVDNNFINLAVASPGQALVALMGRLLTISVIAFALVGGIRRLRNGYLDIPFALLVISPAPMIAGNSYGGEILFRVYLFSLPFLAFFMACLVFPTLTAGRSWQSSAVIVVMSATLVTGFLFAYYGKERAYYFTHNEVDAVEYLTTVAPPKSLFVDESYNLPLQSRNYEYFDYVSLESMSPEDQATWILDPVRQITTMVSDNEYRTAFVIFTRSEYADLEMTGAVPANAIASFEQAVTHSPRFTLIYQNPDARIYMLVSAQGETKK